jgi:hypothetical protein
MRGRAGSCARSRTTRRRPVSSRRQEAGTRCRSPPRARTAAWARRWSVEAERLDAELVDEQAASLVVQADRLGLPPGPVEREHQLPAQLLSKRMGGDELLELPDERPVSAKPKVGVDPPFERGQPKLFEPRDRWLRERLVGEIGEHRPPPERERRAQPLGRRFRVALIELSGRLFDHAFELQCVELLPLDPKEIPRRTCFEDRLRVRPKQLAQLGDVVAHLSGRSSRRSAVVELIGELLDRHDLVGAKEEDRQDTSLSPAAELDRPVPHQDFEWAKDAELSIHLCQL